MIVTVGNMTESLSPETAIERARQLQNDRLQAVRAVAESRQALADVRATTDRELEALRASITERIKTAEKEDARSYNAAVKSGWSAEELKRIGFDAPGKTSRGRKRSPRRAASPAAAGGKTITSDAADAATDSTQS